MTEKQQHISDNCIVCNGPIPINTRSDSKYCSQSCRDKGRKKRPEYVKQYSERNHARHLIYSCKNRAKEKNIPFDLQINDLEIPIFCPVLGIELFRTSGHVGRTSPTIDRIIPEKGYVKGNVRVISHRANALKSDASLEELTLVLDDLKRLYEQKTAVENNE